MFTENAFEHTNNCKEQNFFVKLLMLSNVDDDFMLLYGFCVPTNQAPYPWRYRDLKKTKQSIWSSIMSTEDTENFISSLALQDKITLGTKVFTSPILVKRPTVLSYDRQNKEDGPVSGLCKVSEYWNVNKKDLFKKIQSSFCVDGKELYLNIQQLLIWIKHECGIDFSKNGMRIGNFEVYDYALLEDVFDIEIHKESGLKQTTISKKASFAKDLIVNCISEHRGRIILNQAKLFSERDQSMIFYSDEPMSRVTVKIWEQDSGELIFSKDITVNMGVSFKMNVGSTPYQIRDPWSDKLLKSASNHSDIIKEQIETLYKSTYEHSFAIKSDTANAIDAAIDESITLFQAYQQRPNKGAFIPKNQKEGEINSFIKIREYIEPSSVKRVVIADPYFSVESAQKLLARIPRTDLQLDIITSLAETNPDTNNKTDICNQYRKFLNDNAGIFHNNLSIRNLKRGKEPVFHDRYLIRFFDNGEIDGFLLSNSLNSMGQFYPFVIAPMDKEVCYEVCDYLNFICDIEKQEKQPIKERIECDVLCDFHNRAKFKDSISQEQFPFSLWLDTWCENGTDVKIPKNELSCAINTLWGHWSEEKLLACKMISSLGLTTYPWCVEDLSLIIKNIVGAELEFLTEFIKIAKEKEQQQNYLSYGLYSDIYTRWSLLNGQATPCRQGFSKLFDEAGHVWYAGDNWLRGGYTLMLQLTPQKFVDLLDDIKSPLMFDVLATKMLFYPWSEELYFSVMKSSNLCVQLLCANYLFYQLQENRLTVVQLKDIISKLSPEISILQLSYLLSQMVFHIRISRSMKLKKEEINSIYEWMLKKLANNLPLCNYATQESALHWLFDCEVCSNCRLHLDLAEATSDDLIKEKIYKTIIKVAEHDLISTSYSKDVSELINLYLQAVDALYGDNGETALLGHIIDWHIFEIATEPSLKDYSRSKWWSANIRAQWQLCVLKQYISHHPLSLKVKKWINEWEPRMSVMAEE